VSERAWWQAAVSRLRARVGPAANGAAALRADTLDAYVRKAPSAQNAVDLFAGHWASRLPPPLEGTTGAIAPLYDDPRLSAGLAVIGGVAGRRVLELGPLEAGHTYLLDRCGASDILAIEGSSRAFLKCLIVKELAGIPSARFVLGDFMEYLRGSPARVDVVVASGVLYHMMQPAELLGRIAGITDAVYLWTHYYDEVLMSRTHALAARIVAGETAEFGGYRHTVHRFAYGRALERREFCGGNHAEARWMTRDGILGALAHFGFSRVHSYYDQPDHPNGPAFSIVAQR
jgi:hypothetical protein